MYDVWDVIGLKGTGTDSYSVDNLFIPEKFAALRDDPAALREKARSTSSRPTWCSAWALPRPRSASRARRSMPPSSLARGKTPQGLKAMRENNAVQGLIGRTEAILARRARLSLRDGRRGLARSARAASRSPKQHRIALRIAATWTIHQSASVVDTAYHMAGATAVFAANKFERRFRDMHAIAQQIQARDTHYEDAGKAILSANLDAAPTAR